MIGKSLKKNNVTVTLNVLYAKKEKTYPAYVSKHNSNCEKQVIISMIPNEEKWHYLAVKKLSVLLRGTTLGNLNCRNCLHSFATEKKLESHKKVFENKDFCNVIMSFEGTKMLEFNQYQKSDTPPFTIYAELGCIIEKIDGCKSSLENSFTTNVSEIFHRIF